MDLSDRKLKILQVVVDDYINSNIPISSKYIHETHLNSLSPATIRSELAQLEDMGYLTQPHTSAGRIPSNLAYKLYFESLMCPEKLSDEELTKMKSYFDKKITEVEYIVNNVAKVISDMTNYTSIVAFPSKEEDKIANLKLIKLNETTTILILVTDARVVKDWIVDSSVSSGSEYLDSAERILNLIFVGKKLGEIISSCETITEQFDNYRSLFSKIIEKIKNIRDSRNKEDLVLSGGNKIFEYPEFSDLNKAKNFFSVIDNKDFLIKELTECKNSDLKVNISIDREEGAKLDDCSIVSAHIKVGDKDFGTAGVIGPVRMDYKKVVSVLEGIENVLNNIINDEDGK